MKITKANFFRWFDRLPSDKTFNMRSETHCLLGSFLRAKGYENSVCHGDGITCYYQLERFKSKDRVVPTWLVKLIYHSTGRWMTNNIHLSVKELRERVKILKLKS